MYWRARVLFLSWTFCGCLCNVVRRSPSCSGNVCEFEWTIDYKFTMMWYNKTSEDPVYQPIVQDSIGFVKRRSTTQDCKETHTVVTLSGSYFVVHTNQSIYIYFVFTHNIICILLFIKIHVHICFLQMQNVPSTHSIFKI